MRIMKNREPITMCDVVLFDSRAKKHYRLFDAILVGNDRNLIWGNEYFRDKIIRDVFKTKARIDKQRENLHLICEGITFKKTVGFSNAEWGCTK